MMPHQCQLPVQKKTGETQWDVVSIAQPPTKRRWLSMTEEWNRTPSIIDLQVTGSNLVLVTACWKY
jgi:hypothetical protein